jgi:hypothetical protein
LRLFGETSYYSDKTSKGTLIWQQIEKNKYIVIDRLEYNCSWKVDNGVLITYDFIENGNKTERPPIRDKILKISEEKAVFRDILNNSIFERIRKK